MSHSFWTQHTVLVTPDSPHFALGDSLEQGTTLNFLELDCHFTNTSAICLSSESGYLIFEPLSFFSTSDRGTLLARYSDHFQRKSQSLRIYKQMRPLILVLDVQMMARAGQVVCLLLLIPSNTFTSLLS